MNQQYKNRDYLFKYRGVRLINDYSKLCVVVVVFRTNFDISRGLYTKVKRLYPSADSVFVS